MDAAPISAPAVNTPRAAVEGELELPDGSHVYWALSRREFGPMSFRGRPEWDVASNRMQFLRFWNLKLDQLVSPVLEHTANVEVVGREHARRGAREANSGFRGVDALVTGAPNLILLTTHADCLPMWLIAPESGWIGLAHVGWRGLLAGLVGNMIEAVPERASAGITAILGPGISARRYAIGEDVAGEFLRVPRLADAVVELDGRPHLDLLHGTASEAKRAGAAIDTSAHICTYDTDYLSSYRRDGDTFTPMAAFIVRLGGR